MILPNKILLFLIGCTIAIPCFALPPPFIPCDPDPCDGQDDCTCEIIEPVALCPDGANNCKKRKITRTNETACPEDHYVAYCINMEITFSNVIDYLTQQHFRLADNCWAVDGSLTKEDHYKNMRVLFNIGAGYTNGTIDGIITHMDSKSRQGQEDKGCNTSCDCNTDCANKSSNCILDAWKNNVHATCSAAIDNVGGLVCQKCPDNGMTDNAVKYRPVTIDILDEFDNVVLTNSTNEWVSFNTIADCYITGGEDERGKFKLVGSDAQCYYSKE